MPAVEVRLQSVQGKAFPLLMLPDSGADCSCFPEAWASVLGIDLAACTTDRVHTGAGLADHYTWAEGLRATVAGRTVELTASFGPIGVPVLGRRDFFSRFEVLVDERKQRVLLKPYD